MFFRVKSTGKYRYLQLVENRSQGRHKTQRVLYTLGRLEELEASGCIDSLLRSLGRFSQRVRVVEQKDLVPLKLNGAHLPQAQVASWRREQPTCRATSTTLLPDIPVGRGELPRSATDLELTAPWDHEKTIEVLRKSPIFSHLGQRPLNELSQLTTARRLKAGQFLYFQDGPMDFCYIVASGLIKGLKHSTSGNDFITAVHGPGEMLGKIRLVLGKSHSASGQALVDSTVLAIKKDDFLSFLHRHRDSNSNIVLRMSDLISERYQSALERLSEPAARKTDHRLAHLLFALYLQLGSTMPLTRSEIAQMAGTTTETAVRFVGRLRQTGVFQSFRGRIIVLDPDKLRLLAQAPSPKKG